MNLMMCAASLLLPVLAQQGDFTENRFHRVHLRNGNFIDGQMLKDMPQEVLLKIDTGEMVIRRDQIKSIELIKMRSVNERPAVKTPVKNPVTTLIKNAESTPLPESKSPPDIQKKVNEVIMKYKTDKSPEKGALPVEEIAALGDEAAVYLATILPKLDTALQHPAAVALGTLKSPKAALVLAEQTRHENPLVRLNAAQALGSMGDDEKTSYLRPMLRDPDPAVRHLVISLVNSLEDVQWFDAVGDLCADPVKEVRGLALAMASRLATKHDMKDNFIRLIVGNLGATHAGVRADSAATLGGIGKADHWTSLAPLLRDTDPGVRAATALSLSNLGAVAAGPDIVGQLPVERDHWARIYLAGAAQRLKLASAIEPLINWLRDPNQEIRNASSVSLQTITGERFGPEAEKWEAWLQRSKSK